VAPENATLPYVIFSWAAGGQKSDSPHIDIDGLFYIRAYSSQSAREAGAIRQAMIDLLDRQPLTVTGWTNSWLAAESPHLELTEPPQNGVTVFVDGDHYRLLLDQS
jgi:hypothetical protein